MQEGSHKTVKNLVKNDLTETIVFAGPCFLEGIVINTIGTTCTLSIKDNTAVKITGVLANTQLPHFCRIGMNIETSLKVEMAGSAAANVLIIYKT